MSNENILLCTVAEKGKQCIITSANNCYCLVIDLIVYKDRKCPWTVWLCYETKNVLVEIQFPC